MTAKLLEQATMSKNLAVQGSSYKSEFYVYKQIQGHLIRIFSFRMANET